jgi:eukaryotic-like serine/threonine-protein kinase
MSNQWERVAAVFEAAVAREPTERLSFVRDACADDSDLRHQIESMLAEVDRPMVIDRPVGETVAELLDDDSARMVGARLGPYRVESLLGVGGMGEVYRATDTVLGRQVAIKILTGNLPADPERLARLRREARILASLNHPNIGAIYGVETLEGESGSTLGLVLELVEGPTLAEKLEAGRLPVDEALALARQIAEALEAAHHQGLVHRDLKPANIKVRDDGTVKVLDFGLAKVAEAVGGDDTAAALRARTESAAITTPAITAAGLILGTAAYMSPEQAKGKPADKRSDIWAFGCVVYEMLTGRRPFAADNVAEVLAAVLTTEPDWTPLPSNLPPAFSTFLRRCLHKNPKQRVADVQDIRLALDGAFETATPAHEVSRRVPWGRHIAVLAGAALLGGAVAAAALVWFAQPEAVPRVSRFEIALSPPNQPSVAGFTRDLAITADGSRIVYVGNNKTQLFVRALDALEPVVVFTGTPNAPFISPDGQWIGFADGPTALKKVAIAGGAAVTLAPLDGAFFGATWGPDDTIMFATNTPTIGLRRVSAAGGPVTVVTRPETSGDHLWPELLPGGQAVLFTEGGVTGNRDAAHVVVLDLQSGIRKVLLAGGSDAHYVSSGHLVYAADNMLWGVGFDLSRLETYGTPVPLISDVATTRTGAIDARVARDGTLAYISGGLVNLSLPKRLVWVDRQGRETPLPASPRPYGFPRISPDGTRIALFVGDQEMDIWVWDLGRAILTQATFDPALNNYPGWMPDGRRLIFGSNRAGASNVYAQAADGTGAIERLTVSSNIQYATDVLADGSRLIYTEVFPGTRDDVLQITLDATRRVTPLVQSPAIERNGVVSPDRRWLAYEADSSGTLEVYVRPYPDTQSGYWRVSASGGTRPLWARNGRELFYLTPAGGIMRVGVEDAPSWRATAATLVVKEGSLAPTPGPARAYDVSPDAQRFIFPQEIAGDPTPSSTRLFLVFNWIEELKRLVPTR